MQAHSQYAKTCFETCGSGFSDAVWHHSAKNGRLVGS